jgi:hypothetical protein
LSTQNNFGANNDVRDSKVFLFVSEKKERLLQYLGSHLIKAIDGLTWYLDLSTSPASSEALVETVDDQTDGKSSKEDETKSNTEEDDKKKCNNFRWQ